MLVSVFENFSKVTEDLALTVILDQIRDGRFKEYVEYLRELLAQGKEKEYKAKKKNLLKFATSGTFDKTRNHGNLLLYSAIIILDIDGLTPQMLSEIKAKAIEIPYTYSCFISPSYRGLKILVRINSKAEYHRFVFNQIKAFYEKLLNVPIDPSGSDLARLCLFSYDPDLFQNKDSVIFEFKALPISPKQGKSTIEIEWLIAQIESARLDTTVVYKDWVMLAFALVDTFGAAGEAYFHRLSQFYPNYNYDECSKQYHNCLTAGSKNIRINSLISFVSKKIKESQSSVDGQQSEPSKIEDIIFYYPVFDKFGNLKDVKIDYIKWVEILYRLGFLRFDIGKDFIFVRVYNRIIEEVSVTHIQDAFIHFLESLPKQLSEWITRDFLIGKFYRNPPHYFCDNRLNLLRQKEPLIFVSDGIDDCRIYFRNGFVYCTREGYKLLPYTQLDGHIWKNQIVERDFSFLDFFSLSPFERGEFSIFICNVCGKDLKRYESLTTIIGYLLHSNFSGKLKAVVLTDSKISVAPCGRTGKTLLGQALGYLKKYTELNGKDLDPTYTHKYQEINLDTQIVHLNDVKKDFNFENLFNDITEGFAVNGKRIKSYKVMSKIIISSNRTIKIEGDSARDRAIEFEFSNHYNEKFSPEDEFHHWFFRDWCEEEWAKFYNLFLFCICSYLKNGVIVAPPVNLNRRKLLESTSQEFTEFMDSQVMEGKILPGIEYDKKDLFDRFLTDSPEFADNKNFKQRRFTECLRAYAKYSGHFSSIDPDVHERKSGTVRYVIFPPL